jgi:hypothetical protein
MSEAKCDEPSKCTVSIVSYNKENSQKRLIAYHLDDTYVKKDKKVTLPEDCVRYNICIRADEGASVDVLWIYASFEIA